MTETKNEQQPIVTDASWETPLLDKPDQMPG